MVGTGGTGQGSEGPGAMTGHDSARELDPDPHILQGPSLRPLQIYSVLTAVLGAAAVVWLLAAAPYNGPSPSPTAQNDTATTQGEQQDTALPDQPTSQATTTGTAAQDSDASTASMTSILLYTLLTMAAAGLAGAGLCNLRGLFVYGEVGGGFPRRFAQPYLLRPVIGALNGIFLFFLGSMLVSSLDTSNQTWATVPGRLPYVGVAFLAGYAAQEFLERLKAAAETLFSSSERSREIRARWAEATGAVEREAASESPTGGSSSKGAS